MNFSDRVNVNEKIEISNEVYLSPVLSDDIRQLPALLNDEGISMATMSIPHPYLTSDARAFVDQVKLFEQSTGIRKDYAIRTVSQGLIGGIGLLYQHGLESHRSELGYWLGRQWWGRGIMTQVLKVFSDEIFRQRKLVRLEAHVFEDNLASLRVLEKAGFSREGLLKDAFQKDGRLLSAYLYARIRANSQELLPA